MQFGKPVIIIPAWNEEKYLGRTLELLISALKYLKIAVDIIVVNDGSTDRTREIAKEFGVKIVNLPKNLGKTAAFFAGVKEALKTNPSAVLTLDADMFLIPPYSLKLMLEKAKKATERKETKMFIAGDVKEGGFGCPIVAIGIRSFSLLGLHKMINSKIKKYPRYFGLEFFQNFFFSGKYTEHHSDDLLCENVEILKEASFECEDTYHGRQKQLNAKQGKDIHRMRRILERELKKPGTLRKMRRGMP